MFLLSFVMKKSVSVLNILILMTKIMKICFSCEMWINENLFSCFVVSRGAHDFPFFFSFLLEKLTRRRYQSSSLSTSHYCSSTCNEKFPNFSRTFSNLDKFNDSLWTKTRKNSRFPVVDERENEIVGSTWDVWGVRVVSMKSNEKWYFSFDCEISQILILMLTTLIVFPPQCSNLCENSKISLRFSADVFNTSAGTRWGGRTIVIENKTDDNLSTVKKFISFDYFQNKSAVMVRKWFSFMCTPLHSHFDKRSLLDRRRCRASSHIFGNNYPSAHETRLDEAQQWMTCDASVVGSEIESGRHPAKIDEREENDLKIA